MNPNKLVCAALLAAGLGLFAATSVLADDSAASIAAGGLVPRHETRIVMAKEVLRISVKKVVVDYDFRNDRDQDVTTEVAFPVPPYQNEFPNDDIPAQSFQDFRLWVNGRPFKYATEAKATLKGGDVTEVLSANHIDIATLGHFDATPNTKHEVIPVTRDFDRLPVATRQDLLKAGLFEGDEQPYASFYATFTVHLQYHWTQTFPAHSTVHIRDEYTPNAGFQAVRLETFKIALAGEKKREPKPLKRGRPQDDFDLLMSFCPDPQFLRGAIHAIENFAPASDPDEYPQWVDFILTSANSWKQPVDDFTLIVERGKPEAPRSQRLISFCFLQNAPVTRVDADHFQVHLTNFVPRAELHIGYFDLPEAKPTPAPSGNAR